MRALIVDDSRTMRMIVGNILHEIGFETGNAAHGLEALEWIQTHGFPEIACVDWNMPEMNGLDFVREVRQRQGHETMKILMITTESEANNVSAALESGANEYLMKPFTKEAVIEKLALMEIKP